MKENVRRDSMLMIGGIGALSIAFLLGIFMRMNMGMGFRIVTMRVQVYRLRAESLAQNVDPQNDQHRRDKQLQPSRDVRRYR